MQATNDLEIRTALHQTKLREYHRRADILVVDELGLAHAQARIDIAVINGCVHGYEIKSSADTLDRLPRQLTLYEQCLQKLTIVCAENHTPDVLEMVPAWCGVLEAKKGTRGSVSFSSLRRPMRNPEVVPEQLAHLLWRAEALELLTKYDSSPEHQRRNRKELYAALARHMSVSEITSSIKAFMFSRENWRDRPTPA